MKKKCAYASLKTSCTYSRHSTNIEPLQEFHLKEFTSASWCHGWQQEVQPSSHPLHRCYVQMIGAAYVHSAPVLSWLVLFLQSAPVLLWAYLRMRSSDLNIWNLCTIWQLCNCTLDCMKCDVASTEHLHAYCLAKWIIVFPLSVLTILNCWFLSFRDFLT